MNCNRIRPLLSGYHDDALSLDERAGVRAHVATCDGCRRILESYDYLYAALRQATAPVPADLRRTVYARIAQDERRGHFGFLLNPGFVSTARSVGGTAGLLAVLAALVLVATRLNGTQDNHQGPATLSAGQIAAVGTSVSALIGAARNGKTSRLPVDEQTAIAPAQALSDSVVLTTNGGMLNGNSASLTAHLLRHDRAGVPRYLVSAHIIARPTASAMAIQRIVPGVPTPFPTIDPNLGLAYLRLDSPSPFLRYGSDAAATVEWHSFVRGDLARVLVTPGPANEQILIGLSATLDGRRLVYAARGGAPYGGLFALPMTAPQPTHLYSETSPVVVAQNVPYRYVQQTYAQMNGRFLLTVIDHVPARSTNASVAITSSLKLQTLAPIRIPYFDNVVSPDGQHIAVTEHPDSGEGFGTLEVAHFQSSAPMTQEIGLGAHPAWSPNGRSLLYKSRNPSALFEWSLGNARPIRIITAPLRKDQLISDIAWAPDNRFFAYVVSSVNRQTGDSQVWLGDTQTHYSWKVFALPWIKSIAWAYRPAQASAVPRSTPTAMRPAVMPTTTAGTIASGTPHPAGAGARAGTGAPPAGPLATPTRYDNTTSPTDVLYSYYNAINRREYARAFGYDSPADPAIGRNFAAFAHGYDDTQADTVVRVIAAPYLSASTFHASTCIGLELRAVHYDGKVLRFGGWYAVESTTGQNPRFGGWRIVFARSYMAQGGRATSPTQKVCMTVHRPAHNTSGQATRLSVAP